MNLKKRLILFSGGWTNPHIVDWFGDYANIVFSFYADRVKTWLTINEAITVCDFGYSNGTFAPGILEPIHAPFLCNKYILLSHARAYRIYHQKYSFGKGKLRFVCICMYIIRNYEYYTLFMNI